MVRTSGTLSPHSDNTLNPSAAIMLYDLSSHGTIYGWSCSLAPALLFHLTWTSRKHRRLTPQHSYSYSGGERISRLSLHLAWLFFFTFPSRKTPCSKLELCLAHVCRTMKAVCYVVFPRISTQSNPPAEHNLSVVAPLCGRFLVVSLFNAYGTRAMC